MDLEPVLAAAEDAPEAALRACLELLVAHVGPERSRALVEEALQTEPSGVSGLAEVVQSAQDVESLTRPLLETLQGLTGMASTYLTVVHEGPGVQEIRYSLNTRPGFALPEGLEVPWADTLCKRALDEERACTTDVPAVWGDSDAARDLGITTYVSVPVRLADGTVWGTLCGADAATVPDAERHLPTMGMFARLIASEVERASALAAARRASEQDTLTGCASRRGIDAWLEQARAGSADAVVAVFADLDGFKQVNDHHGHAAGDLVLQAVGEHLLRTCREGDLVGRYGGDEFVVLAALPGPAVEPFLARWGDRLSVDVELPTGVLTASASLGTAVCRPEGVGGLFAAADREMYVAKERHRLGVG